MWWSETRQRLGADRGNQLALAARAKCEIGHQPDDERRRKHSRHDKAGRVCHWILEIHLTDTERQFGGFYEQLLDLG